MATDTVNICIIPAAGRGTRWAPVSGYLPKEMLPLIDKPVIEWVIEEIVYSGCKEILIIINKKKEAIREYLSKNKKLNNKSKINFVYQNEPLGIGHAMFLCRNLIDQKPFAVALPDLPTISHQSTFKQLIHVFNSLKGKTHIISFDKFPPHTLHLYSECLIEPVGNLLLKIKHVCPKTDSNKPHHPGIKLRMSGRFIFKPEIFPVIEKLLKSKIENTEVSDRSTLREAVEQGQRAIGVQIQGHTYDTGYPEGYVRANTAFFKKIARKRGLT